MKRILLLILALVATVYAQAKVVHVIYADGTEQVYSSSQLAAIDFHRDGTVTITGYDGQVLSHRMDAMFERVRVDSDPCVVEAYQRTLVPPILGVMPMFSRQAMHINFFYPSHDPHGEPITLSGSIIVPNNIAEGRDKSQGILLVQRFTTTFREEVPTYGYTPCSAGMLANPLSPDYIAVEVDYYGFGCSERFPQAFCQGVANGRASLDGLLAARQLLLQMGIPYGQLLFNMGYSSGGYDAIATLRAAQTLPGYEDIHFDKTFAGGGPYDLAAVYSDYVERDSVYYIVAPALILSSMIENGVLDYGYEELFTPLITDHLQDWFLSKDYTTNQIMDSIGRTHTMSDMMQPPFVNTQCQQYQTLLGQLADLSLMAPGWTPDPQERIALYHSSNDEYIPIASTQHLVAFLQDHGYTQGGTLSNANLQVSNSLLGVGHLMGAVELCLNILPAIKVWPRLHSNAGPSAEEEVYRQQCQQWLETIEPEVVR